MGILSRQDYRNLPASCLKTQLMRPRAGAVICRADCSLKNSALCKRIFPLKRGVGKSPNSKNKAIIRPLLNYPHKYIKCDQIPGSLVSRHPGHKHHQQCYYLRKASHQIRDPDKRQTDKTRWGPPPKCLSAPRFMMQKIWPKLSAWFMVTCNKPKSLPLPPTPSG